MKKKLFLRLLIVAAAAFLLTFFFQWRCYGEKLDSVLSLMLNHKRIFLYNVLLMFWLVLFFSAFFRGAFVGAGITWAITIVISYINKCKFDLRATPLLPEDFQLASETGSLMQFIDWGDVVKTALAAVLAIALGIFLSRLFKDVLELKDDELPKFLQSNQATKKFAKFARQAAPKILIALVAIAGFMLTSAPVRNGNGTKHTKIKPLKMTLYAWNQTKNYDANGFLVGFLYNLSKFELERPADYSEDAISTISAKYIEEQDKSKTKDLEKLDYNIVIVMNESFYDPSVIRDYYNYSGEVTPNLRSLMQNYPSGYMYTPEYGGGTANVEYEAFTGLTNYWAHTVPYTAQIPKIKNEILALPNWLKTKGYATTAIHPYNGSMYKRNLALPKIGFDTFITESDMKDAEHDGKSLFINDRAAYNEVLKTLETSEQKQLVGLITMQNHASYSVEEKDYPERPWLFPQIEEWWPREQLEIYFETLHYSDKYLGEFVEKLGSLNEKTVVLFFGDHAPGIFPLVSKSKEKEVSDLAHLTPYFVYANFDLKTKKSLPTTTPNCLTNTALDILKVGKPSWYYLLDDVCSTEPILTSTYLGDNTPEETEVLTEYRLLNYDVLGGEQYWGLK